MTVEVLHMWDEDGKVVEDASKAAMLHRLEVDEDGSVLKREVFFREEKEKE